MPIERRHQLLASYLKVEKPTFGPQLPFCGPLSGRQASGSRLKASASKEIRAQLEREERRETRGHRDSQAKRARG
ncbi:unnamed protein product [Boreogadus saida]